MFPRKTEVLFSFVPDHVIDNATNEGDWGLSHLVGEKPRETLGGLLGITGEVKGTEISPVRARDELDSGRLIEDSREGVGERHREVRMAKEEARSKQNRRDEKTARVREVFLIPLNMLLGPPRTMSFLGP